MFGLFGYGLNEYNNQTLTVEGAWTVVTPATGDSIWTVF